MTPLFKQMCLLIVLLLAFIQSSAHRGMIWLMFGLFVIHYIALAVAAFRLLWKDRDALHSEAFLIRKLELQRGEKKKGEREAA